MKLPQADNGCICFLELLRYISTTLWLKQESSALTILEPPSPTAPHL